MVFDMYLHLIEVACYFAFHAAALPVKNEIKLFECINNFALECCTFKYSIDICKERILRSLQIPKFLPLRV